MTKQGLGKAGRRPGKEGGHLGKMARLLGGGGREKCTHVKSDARFR